ncbi:6-hydroxycyclohex-1-ene-1-carbonyl-CoA dehydrogenase [bacterium]|nr:6-hydroxycyclohex-1-ene-1-carbonyl-CoA dehydrogenase [bacterium]
MNRAWVMTAQGSPCEEREVSLPATAPGEALVAVAGCGVCHTDIAFLYGGVPTRAELPLTLGHEISGLVLEVGEGVDPTLVGRPVLVPAVMPCGECALCQAGRRRICRAQVMPGNDRHGGFASHVQVPARFLCPVGEDVLARNALWELAVVADAVTTPFQAIKNAGVRDGDLAVVIGAGGIGIHAVQIAAAAGARVIALDVDARKLETAKALGAGETVHVHGLEIKDIRGRVKEAARDLGADAHCWKLFETSGTRAGQETALALLGFGAHLAVVGFTLDKLEFRLSNLMAFDATLVGNWGSDPAIYPEVLEWIAAGKLEISPLVERYGLDDLNRVLAAAHAGNLLKRPVIVP